MESRMKIRRSDEIEFLVCDTSIDLLHLTRVYLQYGGQQIFKSQVNLHKSQMKQYTKPIRLHYFAIFVEASRMKILFGNKLSSNFIRFILKSD